MDVVDIISHEEYNSDTYQMDFAMLKLAAEVNFEEFPHIRPACLPLDHSPQTYAGVTGTVTGWGLMSAGGNYSTKLQEARVTVMSNEDCRKYYADFGPDWVTEDMLCANGQGVTDACSGDSGIEFVIQTRLTILSIRRPPRLFFTQ